MCGKRSFLAACFLLCFCAAFSWAGEEEALEKIEQARSRLTLLGQSLEQRAIDLTERERISTEERQASQSEREALKAEREALTAERQSYEKEKKDLADRERSIVERERALPAMEKSLKTLTDSYEKQGKSLGKAKRGRSFWFKTAVFVSTVFLVREGVRVIQ